MYQDYKDLLSAFQSHGVKYLVVGGFAVIYHAQPRFTKDLDLFIKPDPANAKATYAALAQFGAPLQGISPDDFTDPKSFFRFGRDPKGFDILSDIPGADFDAVWERRVVTVVDEKTGLKALAPLDKRNACNPRKKTSLNRTVLASNEAQRARLRACAC